MNVRDLIKKLSKVDPEMLVALQDQEGLLVDLNVVVTSLPVERGRFAYVYEFGTAPKERVVVMTPYASPGDNPEEL